MKDLFPIRIARDVDIPALEALIPLSVRGLQASFYSEAQMRAALGPVFGVDRQLIADGTYFVVEHSAQTVGCGGWSRRSSVFGGDQGRISTEAPLDPATDPARVRAFFVHPDWARRGIGTSILAACEAAIRAAGFRDVVLVATLAGEPLYKAAGYVALERFGIRLQDDLTLPVVRMTKRLVLGGSPNQKVGNRIRMEA